MGEVVALGIDVGATALHLVGLEAGGAVALPEVETPGNLSGLLRNLKPGTWVAIDAPDQQRNSLHVADETLAPKFRTARCAEVALGRRGHWVPWVTPALGREAPGWMVTGFRVWQETRDAGMQAIEVYPHSAFRVLVGAGKLAKKQTPAGMRQRVELLQAAGVRVEGLVMSHDFLDAAVAAVVARDARAGTAERVLCDHADGTEHDGSSLWLPASSPPKHPPKVVRMREEMQSVDLHGVMAALAAERPVFHSEADFQHALAWKLQQLLPDANIRLEFKPFPSERFYVDVWLKVNQQVIALELKYPTRRLVVEAFGERFELKDQAAQDITRYDFVKDLTRIERMVESDATAGCALLLTNDSAYWKEALRPDSVDVMFRLAEGRVLSGGLAWATHAGPGTMRRREAELVLRHPHQLRWREYSSFNVPYGRFRYLLVSVPLVPSTEGPDER
jgi:predicted nuclease with RNAse H fold